MEERRSAVDLLARWRALIYRVTLGAVVISVAVSLLMPNWYSASATCMPPQEGESRGGLLSMFSQIGVDFGASGLLSSTPMSDITIGVLKSRLLRAQVVDDFDLERVYRADSREHAVEELNDHLIVTTTPEGFIEVRVEDRSRQRAADMANAFMQFLDDYSRRTSVEQATRTRGFIEEALGENEERLAAATGALRQFQERYGAIDLPEQTKATVEALAELESEKAQLEIERGVLEGFSGPDQTRMREIEAELRMLQNKLDQFGGSVVDSGTDSESPAALIPLSGIPRLASQLADLTRDVVVQEKVRTYLSSQLEEARIQETKDLEIVHVLDKAVPPLKKARPRRSIIVILSVVLAFAASVGVAFFAESFLDYTGRSRPGSGFSSSKEVQITQRVLLRLRRWGGPTGDDDPA
jgi:tyrosine-protein kinase Etk/Wzc